MAHNLGKSRITPRFKEEFLKGYLAGLSGGSAKQKKTSIYKDGVYLGAMHKIILDSHINNQKAKQ